jgi:hypothetical protein
MAKKILKRNARHLKEERIPSLKRNHCEIHLIKWGKIIVAQRAKKKFLSITVQRTR